MSVKPGLHVGINSGCGNIQGPLISEGSIKPVFIPDNKRVVKS